MENKPLRNFLIGVGSTIVSILFLIPLLVLILILTVDFEYISYYIKYIIGIVFFLLSGLFLDQAIVNKCVILAILCMGFIIAWINLLILN